MIFNPIYLIILGVGLLLSLGASALVKLAFASARQVPMRNGITGAEVARAILRQEGIHDVEVVQTEGFLSDHYNPMRKTLALSPDVYHGQHAAAAGVAAHEVGHAIQHARNYMPMWMRSVLVPPANIGSQLGPWLVFGGIVMGAAEGAGYGLALAGVILFGAATLFTLITVPVEFDASARAKRILATTGITSGYDEDRAVSKVLTAAGLTYVAAAVVSLMQLLYWAWQAGLIGGRR
jgi:uncharacterized protein